MSTSGRGFQIPYPAITLHAVSRADSGPSIYCQLDDSVGAPDDPTDDTIDMRELTIVPQNQSSRKLFPFAFYLPRFYNRNSGPNIRSPINMRLPPPRPQSLRRRRNGRLQRLPQSRPTGRRSLRGIYRRRRSRTQRSRAGAQ